MFGLSPLRRQFADEKAPNKLGSPTAEAFFNRILETVGETWVQFRVQYYIYALVFVIFDIETVFLYPWAVAYNKLGLFALVEMFIFLAVQVGLIFAGTLGIAALLPRGKEENE